MKTNVVVLDNVSKSYRTAAGWHNRQPHVLAVQNVSLKVQSGDVYGLIGESGSGKSTLMRLVTALEQPSSGKIMVGSTLLNKIKPAALRNLRREMQIVFQDPYGALDPLQTVEAAIEEPLLNFSADSRAQRRLRVLELLREVGLPERLTRAYPYQLSGGERQRVCIARALAPRPKLLICDEPVSALDKSIQAQILNLLRDLQRQQGLTYLFISHDLAVINQLSTRVAVMLRGRIVEEGNRLQVLLHSAHPYTRNLVAAAAYFTGEGEAPRLVAASDEIPQNGCIFRERCPFAQAICEQVTPPWKDVAMDHKVACHFPLTE